MEKSKQLNYTASPFSTYHSLAVAGIALMQNPKGYNWYLNNSVNMYCGRRFLTGYTSPEVNVACTGYNGMRYLERYDVSYHFARRSIVTIIKKMIDENYYVLFAGNDDYYIKGKSMYHEQHFYHDGIILGYDDTDKSFTAAAYDSNWLFSVFRISYADFRRSMNVMCKAGRYGRLIALKAKKDDIALETNTILKNIKQYLDSDFTKYPQSNTSSGAEGIIVHDYLSIYMSMLNSGEIPYERMDRRILRLVCEHKKCMLERIRAVEEKLGLTDTLSREYEPVYRDSELIRILYAKYNRKKNTTTLPFISDKLLKMKEIELSVLT